MNMAPKKVLMKWQSAIVVCVILLTGCTSPFVYNRLDTLVAWYLEGLVTLDQRQRTDLRAWLGQTLDWHRDSELERYAQFTRTLAQQSADGADRTTFEQAENQFRAFTAAVARRSAPEAAKLMLGLTDRQVEELSANLEKQGKERLAKEQKLLKKGQWHERRAKQITKQFRRWVGDINAEQQALIRGMAQKLEPSYPEWLESQRAWRAALRMSLNKRQQNASAAASELTAMLTDPDDYWTATYRRKLEANRARTLNLLLALNASLSTEQRAELQRRLTKFAEELESLAHNPNNAT
jgi:hypothetical protein